MDPLSLAAIVAIACSMAVIVLASFVMNAGNAALAKIGEHLASHRTDPEILDLVRSASRAEQGLAQLKMEREQLNAAFEQHLQATVRKAEEAIAERDKEIERLNDELDEVSGTIDLSLKQGADGNWTAAGPKGSSFGRTMDAAIANWVVANAAMLRLRITT